MISLIQLNLIWIKILYEIKFSSKNDINRNSNSRLKEKLGKKHRSFKITTYMENPVNQSSVCSFNPILP